MNEGTQPELRARLIRAGLRRVEKSGAAKLSLREVAKLAGVSHMAPYSHFRDKGDLLCAIAAAGFSELQLELRRAAATARRPAPQFLASGLAYIEFARQRPQLLELMFGGLVPAAEHTEELSRARGLAFGDLAALVQAARLRRDFRKIDPAIAALAGWSIAHGFAQLSMAGEIRDKLGGDSADMRSAARTVLSLVVDGLRVATPARRGRGRVARAGS